MPLPSSGIPKKHFDSQWFLQFRHVSLNEQKCSRFIYSQKVICTLEHIRQHVIIAVNHLNDHDLSLSAVI